MLTNNSIQNNSIKHNEFNNDNCIHFIIVFI